ncbi:MAG TPA: carboxypeptidase regulatory-like domain-containing protein [Candidatus Acidoferrum sp.]|nr:carboxypeptidase regulatory-like domain-containing protein [Candidatus Acidoferrum sp.]
MGNRGVRAFLLLFLIMFVVAVNSSFGQAGTSFAQLNGTVLDPSGGSVGKANVVLREVNTNHVYNATASDNGYYVIPNLPPGQYELKASFTGFAPYTQTGIVLRVGQMATIDVTLKLQSGGEKVVVTTEVQQIEPTRTEVSQVIDAKQIDTLPISGRLFTDFALLTPAVATSRTSLGTTFTEFEVTQISFAGMRSFSNEITVDGADFVNSVSGVQRSTPPQESVQEFRVVNNSFGSEYGRALGGIVNIVTKSGTNDMHGSIYDFLQNNATDARSVLQPSPLPYELRQNQFGATLGGPIKKDKTFYFLNYEGKRRGESPTYAPDLVNNLAEIDQAKQFMGLSPEGCYLPPLQCTGTPFSYLQSVLKSSNTDYGFVRIDHQFNPNNNLAIRYLIEDARFLGELIGNTLDGGGLGTPSGGRNNFIRDQSLVGTYNTVIRPNLANTFLAQYARRHYNFPGSTGEPDLSVVNDLEFGHNFGTYDAIYESRAEFADSISWIKGNHSAKFGFDGNYVWSANNYPGFTPERILFPNLSCMFQFANFVEGAITGVGGTLPGVPNSPCPLAQGADGVGFLYWGVALPRTGFTNGYVPQPATGGGYNSGWPNAFPTNMYGNFQYTLNHGYWGFFAQDQWKIKPNLTVNYGLRWDFESGLGNHSDSYYGAVQPRIGLAWSPDRKTVVRAGFGLFFDRNNLTFYFTTGNQKALPGYFCQPPSADAGCATANLAGVTVPMIQKQAASGGWQLSAQPGYPGTPSLPCAPNGPLPPIFCTTGPTGSIAAITAFSILAGGPNSYNPVTLTGPCTLTPAGPAGACGVGSGGIQRDGKLPYAEQASLEIDRQIGGGLTVDVAYIFVGAHRLVRGNNINVPCPAGTAKAGNPYTAQGLLNPDGSLTPCQGAPTLGPFGLGPFFSYLNNGANPLLPYNPSGLEFGVPSAGAGIPAISGEPTLSGGLLDYNNNVANAAYNGLTFSAIERMGKVFTLNANYTFSHTIDNGNFTTFINLPQNQFDYAAERANSNQDVRQRFVANFTATAPEDTWLRKFEFSSIITIESGRPFTLFVGNNTFGDVAGQSTDRVGGPPLATAACPSVEDCSTTVTRNTYIGDPLRTWDLRLSRYFKFKERYRLDASVDAFNVLNRTNVDEVSSIYGSPVFCGASPVVPKHYKDAATVAIETGAVSCAPQQAAGNPGAWLALGLLPVSIPNNPNATFGQPRTMFNPRQFQFSLKLSF